MLSEQWAVQQAHLHLHPMAVQLHRQQPLAIAAAGRRLILNCSIAIFFNSGSEMLILLSF